MSINIQCTNTKAVNVIPGGQTTHPASHARKSLSPAWATELEFITLWMAMITGFT